MGSKLDPYFETSEWYSKLSSDIESWPLMSNIAIPIGSCIVYFLFVIVIGPWFMKNREPMKLKKEMLVYNIFQVGLSAWFMYLGSRVSLPANESKCLPEKERIVNMEKAMIAMWWYTMGKFTELLDTVFFVLRKNNHQITWLHLYHHSSMVMLGWGLLKYFMGEQVVAVITLNSFIHVLMYSYYLVAGLGPKYRKYLWWKQHMTSMQIIQFVIIIVVAFYLMNSDCTYNKGLCWVMVGNAIIILSMFANFYIQSYIKKPKGIPLKETQKIDSFNVIHGEMRQDDGLRRRQ